MARPSHPVAVLHLIAFRIGMLFMRSLPMWAWYRFVGGAAMLAYRLIRKYRRFTRSNFRMCFPERFKPGDLDDPYDPALEAMAQRAWRHIFYSFADAFLGRRKLVQAGCERFVEVRASEETASIARGSLGVPPIILMGHAGSWEIASHVLSRFGVPGAFLARPLDSYLIEKELEVERTASGMIQVSKFKALPKVIRLLRGKHAVIFLADQDAGYRARGVFVKFFGRYCKAVDAWASLALKMGHPAIPMFPARVGESYRFVVELQDPLPVPENPDYTDLRQVQALVQAYHDRLADWVYEHPAQYMWLHHKWRTRPPGETWSHPEFADIQPDAEDRARLTGVYGGEPPPPGPYAPSEPRRRKRKRRSRPKPPPSPSPTSPP